nr:heat shock protein 90 B [Halisarca dujardinii]
MKRSIWLVALVGLLCLTYVSAQEDPEEDVPTAEPDIGSSRDASKTDDEVVQREEEAIKLDGLSVSQMKELRDQADKFTFQAEVNKMMKLIINSLYRNKEIFLRELISNASDALDKIRFLSLTDKAALEATDELSIRIKVDEDSGALHISDTGIGMTREELVNNLGTIAKSGTSEFFQKMEEAQSSTAANDLIGQFGVGFYSTFLVADRVVVASKSNDDKQYIWESDASGFSIVEDPRGDTLLRGTQISLFMKEDVKEYLDVGKVRELIMKYSQFINFPIYVWESRDEEFEEPIEEEDEPEVPEKKDGEEEEAEVEEEAEEKPKTKKITKTVWDWVLVNDTKPIWLRNSKEVTDEEYTDFYKSFTRESEEPLARVHFKAEGEVTFKAILFVPKKAPNDLYTSFSNRIRENMKLYVRRVFITDDFDDMMPKYLRFISGVVDSDDLPLNVSREMLQQNKLLLVIKKKLVRKVLDMIRKLDEDKMKEFIKEFGTSLKLGVMEDQNNRSRIAKLLRFSSSNHATESTTLDGYLERMKDSQQEIFFMAGTSRAEVEKSPFVERLLRRGYEVLYLTEAIDEYVVQHLSEYEKKKFQNVAKEGLNIEESKDQKEHFDKLQEEMKPLTEWLKSTALPDQIEKAVVSNRLTESPCALVASQHGWSGNMERIMKSQAYAKQDDPMAKFYLEQKKTLEINPYHPVILEIQKRIQEDEKDAVAVDSAQLLFETASMRSGYAVKDSSDFAGRIERMMRMSLGVDPTAKTDYVEVEESEEEEEEEGEEGGEVEEGVGEQDGGVFDDVSEEDLPVQESEDEKPAEGEVPADEVKDEL